MSSSPDATVTAELAGVATIYCLRPDGTRRDERVQHNMITNAGFDGLATYLVSDLTAYLGVGSSNTAPAEGQTALVTPVALGGAFRTNTTHTGDTTVSTTAEYVSWKRVRKFPVAVADAILREWGFFRVDTGGAGDVMWNREVFRDGGGVAADYTVLTGEQLVIELDVRLYPPAADAPSTITVSGASYEVVVRAAFATANTWSPGNFGRAAWDTNGGAGVDSTVGLVDRTSSFAVTTASSRTVAAYVAGSFYADVSYVWEPANFTSTVNRMTFCGGRLQCSFSPGLAKTSSKRLQLTIRISWARR